MVLLHENTTNLPLPHRNPVPHPNPYWDSEKSHEDSVRAVTQVIYEHANEYVVVTDHIAYERIH